MSSAASNGNSVKEPVSLGTSSLCYAYAASRQWTSSSGWRTYVLLASTFVRYLGAYNAHKNANLVACLIDFVSCPVDALQGSLGDHI